MTENAYRTRPSRTGRSRDRDSRWAWMLPVGIIVLGLLELTMLILIGRATSLWIPVLLVVLGWIVAVALAVAAGHQSFIRLRSLVRALRGSGDVTDHLSRPAFTLLAAAAFAFPGLLTDVLGVVLLLTPVQRRAVERTGLGSASGTSRRLMLRRRDGVVAGEIIVEDERANSPSARASRSHGSTNADAPLQGRVLED